MANQAKAVFLWQSQTKFIDMSFAAPRVGISHFTLTSQESHLLRSVKSIHVPAPRQQVPQLGNVEIKPAPPQDLQWFVDLTLEKKKALWKAIAEMLFFLYMELWLRGLQIIKANTL